MMPGWTMGTEAWIWMGAWALVMVLAVWVLVREPRRETHDDPGEILRARFARGEISEEEFRRACDALASTTPVPRVDGVERRATQLGHHGQETRHD
jgi:putative membrane protein